MNYLKQQKHCFKAVEDTKNNTGMVLTFALNYGSRAEIIEGNEGNITLVKQRRGESKILMRLFLNHLQTQF